MRTEGQMDRHDETTRNSRFSEFWEHA